MKITQTNLCDICGLNRSGGNHADCAKKKQAMYADIKHTSRSKREKAYKTYDPLKKKNHDL